MKIKKITLQYKCRRCSERYFVDSKIINLKYVDELKNLPATIDIHDCDDNHDKLRFGIADLIGYNVE